MTIPLTTCSNCSKPLVWTSTGDLICPRATCIGHGRVLDPRSGRITPPTPNPKKEAA